MKQRGFTIVEIMVVIVVIAILSAFVTLSYRAWREDSIKTAIRADLRSAAQAMEQYRNFNNAYPDISSGDNKIPNYNGGPVRVYIQTVDRKSYCLEAERGNYKMHIKSTSTEVLDNGC